MVVQELTRGQELELRTVTLTYDMCLADNGPTPNSHNDREMAKAFGFDEAIVAGPHLTSIVADAMTELLGQTFLSGGSMTLRFVHPTLADDSLVIKAIVTDVTEKQGRRFLEVDLVAYDANKENARRITGRAAGFMD